MKLPGRAGLGSLAALWLLVLGLWTGLQRPREQERRFPAGTAGRGLPQELRGWERGGPGAAAPAPSPPGQGESRGAQKTFRALLTLPAAGDRGEPLEGLEQPAESSQPEPRQRQNLEPGSREPLAREAPADPASPVQGGIFWSRALEQQVPPGFDPQQAASWLETARAARVASLERGGCGRSSNRLARLSDGSRACVRYGINPEQIQGEALSYRLAQLLGIQQRLPPMTLALVEARGRQWGQVRDELRGSHWAEGAVVSLTQWVDNLTDVVAPAPWRSEAGSGRRLQPLAAGELGGLTQSQLVELVQWTDLILFDYLTANFDRLVSNLFSLQWDSRVMHRATSNLHRAPSGGLVFIDNEAGLVHGYRLLSMWDKYNEPLLRSVCIFREATAQRVRDLHRLQNAASELLRLYRTHEPLSGRLGFLSEQQAQLLQDRIDFVHKHILHCKAMTTSL
ncbi:four-jointed box protein 1 [Gopherus flavomarginatus]|uniref:four-jointed box protein 1 n=1 Tax=Gopherus flavomarginatus TaxID=286002 RepID=UPI0021CBE95D|nr:four-jointed box protein 1 [Gopherus flavomarginatus]